MKFLIKDLKAYIIIALSVAYASYTTAIFLHNLVINRSIAVLTAIALSIIAHLYLVEGTKDLKVNKFNASFLVAILLCGSVVYFDLSGVSKISKNTYIAPVHSEFQQKIAKINEQVSAVEKVLLESAQHTKAGKTNWALYNTYNKSQQQLKDLQRQEAQLKIDFQEKLQSASVNAGEQENQMIGISIILFMLSCLVSFSLHPTEQNLKIDHTKTNSEEQPAKTKNTTTNSNKNTPSVEDILQGILGDKNTKNNQVSLNLFKSHDRIRIAAAYISKSGIKDHRILSEKFHLNFSQISKAKSMASLFSSEKGILVKDKQVVGFSW